MILKAGDEMKCWKCTGWHVLHTTPTPSPGRPMLFITCHGGLYYAGGEGLTADQQVRPPKED